MMPANNTVSYSGSSVQFVFTEHVDEGSFLQSLEITPEPPSNPEIRWNGRKVVIKFREPLADSTTYIFTLGTQLRDLRNVTLKAPITRAISTGPVINKARVSGRIIDPITGSGVTAMQVFAYAVSDTIATGALPARPLYRTETDDEGNFVFDYLSRRPYFILGVDDRNSSRGPDVLERVAVPPTLSVVADTTAAPIGIPWYAAVFDTVAPELRRIQPLSATRALLRYSEDIYLDLDSISDWIVSDSTETRVLTASALYRPHGDNRSVVVVVQPLARGRYRLTPGVVTDSAANHSARIPQEFVSDGRADTAAARFETFLPVSDRQQTTLGPGDSAGLKLSVPADSQTVAERFSVVDTSGKSIAHVLRSSNGVDFFVESEVVRNGEPFDLVWKREAVASSAADSANRRRYRVIPDRELGDLSGVLVGYPDTTRVVVQAISRGDTRTRSSATADADGRFLLRQLSPGSYRLRIYRDDNRNARWDAGSIAPYRVPEPIYWTTDSLRVRARWETEIDTIQIQGFLREG